jgi:hypothetical protein
MGRSGVTSSRLPPGSLRNAFASAVIFAAFGLVGCGTTCYSGFINNGFLLNVTSPASACTLNQAKGAVHTAVVKTASCESCTAGARVEHIFVTLRGVQLHPSVIAEQNSPDWVEIAPQLAEEPRQIDLIGGSSREILAESSMIPAGSYRQVRLQFLTDSPADGERFPGEGECGAMRNCVVMGDGHVEAVRWTSDVPELVITGQGVEGGSVVVLPDTRMEIRISLEPRQVFTSSGSEPWVAEAVLVGRAVGVREKSENRN